MAIAETLLPPDTVFGLRAARRGPIRAGEFEGWGQEEGNPVELVEGWVLPMTPGNFLTGKVIGDLYAVLLPLMAERGWSMALDARHRLPHPPDTVVFPDLVVHCSSEVGYVPGTETVSRVPDLVIELLSEETTRRDTAPRGAKFLAYQMSGVREYYYAWPDGREAAGFRLGAGGFTPLEPDAEGFFSSPLLGRRLRLAEPALR